MNKHIEDSCVNIDDEDMELLRAIADKNGISLHEALKKALLGVASGVISKSAAA